MYIGLLLLLLVASVWLVTRGLGRGVRGLVVGGGALAVATVAFYALMSFWGEMLWFDALGFGQRFWTEVGARVVMIVGAAALVGAVVALLLRALPPESRGLRRGAWILGAVGALLAGVSLWDEWLLYLNRVSAGTTDPVLGLDVGFYLFTLPFLSAVQGLLAWAAVVALGATLLASLQSGEKRLRLRPASEIPLGTLLASTIALAVVLTFDRVLAVFELLNSDWGVVAGPGWTDVHVRLPAQILVAVATLALGLLAWSPTVRAWAGRRGEGADRGLRGLRHLWVGTAAIWILALGVAPRLVQWLVVEPNEITFERPYIENNIAATRAAFGLDRVEQRRFPAREELTRATVDDNRDLLNEVRLWDWRALDAVYKQFQEIRLYYEFSDVDIDRYAIGDRTRQVMVSARELELSNLPEQSQTFVNRRFKYTHGYGLTMATVSDFTQQGLPNLLVRDIPPKAEPEELSVERPQIYYGELTDEPAVVNTEEREFDHPSGDENVYNRYAGTGGVQLTSFWRKLIYGWKFDGTRLLVSGYPTEDSRVLFHRTVRERVQNVAPFLEIDDDPYVVLVDGRLHWIVDAYTRADRYPYSEPYSSREVIEYRDGDRTRRLERTTVPSMHGANYVRNAVKVAIDAYDGSVDLYVFEPDDPLVRAWQKAFPDLFTPREQMPEALERHVRYPVDLLLVQGLVQAKYHMQEPEVFYNQEDLWVRATEKYYSGVQPVEPYYVMWEQQGSDEVEFVLILPFTPKNRQVLIGWIAGMSDPPNYGRFLAYEFPKDRRVIGPQQVETKIDQDRFLSGQLTLWDQRGSNVIRGNVLAIPLDETLLYVEPIYLQAETAAYPELRLVAVMHGDDLSYAESFDAALEGLFDDTAGMPEGVAALGRRELIRRANELLGEYARLQGEEDFEAAGQRLQELSDVLQRLVDADEAGRSR